MNSSVDQIKDRLSIIDVVSSYIKLEKAGINYKACCPFHNEKTPSFFVSPTRGSFHCFGCAKGGDIFTFVQEIEGVDFNDALKELARRAGVEISFAPRQDKGENEILYRILDEATSFYEQSLESAFEAKKYLEKRGLTGSTIRHFRIGYAPEGWRNLHSYLIKKNYKESDMEKAGLVIKSEKGYYDRFRGRIMFPIADQGGRIIAFSGRIFPQSDDPKNAKYVNSPETILYNKSVVLFGYDKAKQAMLRTKRVIVVEGQMDLVMSHQSGVEETVAVSGTALTDQHLSLLHRFTNTLILCFDADSAGVSAVARSAERAIKMGFEVRVAELPQGLDPADLILKNKDEWQGVLLHSTHVVDFFVSVTRKKGLDERTFKKEIARVVFPYIAVMSDRIDQTHFIHHIAQVISTNEDIIRKEIEKYEPKTYASPPMLTVDAPPDKSRKEIIEEEIAGIFLAASSIAEISLDEEKNLLEEIIPGNTEELKKRVPEYRQGQAALQAEIIFTDPKRLKDTLRELITNLKKEILTEEYSSLREKIREKESDGLHDEALILLQKCNQLLEKLREI